MSKIKKVMVGVSGGVDSAVSAFLLKQQGYEVAGGTFRLWDNKKTTDLDDAKAVCAALDIPHFVFDLRDMFRSKVMQYFSDEYDLGRTPNPCVVCNRTIKFGEFLRQSRELGYDYVSTGHYAHVLHDEVLQRFRVKKAKYDKKDQSYVFYSLSQEQLGSIILPLGDYDKPQIREIARESNLPVSNKSDSQDICFIPDGDYAAFLREFSGNDGKIGDFVDESGNILGRHKGIRHYTIGQRKGIGISFAQPMFVADIDPRQNTVTLAQNDTLMRQSLKANQVNWIDFDELAEPTRVQAKIRYGSNFANAIVTPFANNSVQVNFDEPQRAITAGQSVVFYHGDYLIGGGVIEPTT